MRCRPLALSFAIIKVMMPGLDESRQHSVNTPRLPMPSPNMAPSLSICPDARCAQTEAVSVDEFSMIDLQRVVIDLVGLLHDEKATDSDSLNSYSDSSDSDSPGSGSVSAAERFALASESQRTLLHLGAALGFDDLLRELIAHAVDLNQRDISGYTALHYAAVYGHFECAKCLIDGGADVQVRDEWGRLAQELAMVSGHHRIEEILRGVIQLPLGSITTNPTSADTQTGSAFEPVIRSPTSSPLHLQSEGAEATSPPPRPIGGPSNFLSQEYLDPTSVPNNFPDRHKPAPRNTILFYEKVLATEPDLRASWVECCHFVISGFMILLMNHIRRASDFMMRMVLTNGRRL
jgi:hypothetical protein